MLPPQRCGEGASSVDVPGLTSARLLSLTAAVHAEAEASSEIGGQP
jgi:hypothetical protein